MHLSIHFIIRYVIKLTKTTMTPRWSLQHMTSTKSCDCAAMTMGRPSKASWSPTMQVTVMFVFVSLLTPFNCFFLPLHTEDLEPKGQYIRFYRRAKHIFINLASAAIAMYWTHYLIFFFKSDWASQWQQYCCSLILKSILKKDLNSLKNYLIFYQCTSLKKMREQLTVTV